MKRKHPKIRTEDSSKKSELKEMPFGFQALIIGIACIIGYFSILSVGFLCDDFVFLYGMKRGIVMDMASGGVYFRPFAILWSAIDWLIFGLRPFGYHLVNLAWHIAASIGVALLARSFVPRHNASLLAGLIFALHPAHPEAVTWISGRFDVICGALSVWSLVLYTWQTDLQTSRSRFFRVASIALFGLACLSKEQALIFPITVMLYEFFPFADKSSTSTPASIKIRRALPYFIVAALMFGFRLFVFGGIGGYIPDESHKNLLAKSLYHLGLQPFIILFHPLNRSLLDKTSLGWILTTSLLLLAPLLFAFKSSRRILLFCVLAIIVSAIPSAHLGIAEGSLQNSRFLYTPSVFFSILIAALFSAGFESKWKKAASLLTVLYIFTLLLCLFQNNYPWQEAGRIVQKAEASTIPLHENHKGEWGTKIKRIVAFNVPSDYMGAWVFKNGLPEMLGIKYDDLRAMESIKVIPAGVQTSETVQEAEQAAKQGAVVWLFRTIDSTLAEYGQSNQGADSIIQ